ncbi:hypothetical protein Tco_0463754, partial [Tanacetum coccineum]
PPGRTLTFLKHHLSPQWRFLVHTILHTFLKHHGVRSDDSLWDKPVEDFFSSESESDDDIEDYIPPIPYGAFKDWEIVRCSLRNTYYHVYYQENRRHKNFFYLKELLPDRPDSHRKFI